MGEAPLPSFNKHYVQGAQLPKIHIPYVKVKVPTDTFLVNYSIGYSIMIVISNNNRRLFLPSCLHVNFYEARQLFHIS